MTENMKRIVRAKSLPEIGVIQVTETWALVRDELPLRETAHNYAIDTENETIREALIALGWQPPAPAAPARAASTRSRGRAKRAASAG